MHSFFWRVSVGVISCLLPLFPGGAQTPGDESPPNPASPPRSESTAEAKPDGKEPSPARTGEETPRERDWLESYYLDPKPDQLIEQIKDWSQQGLLGKPGSREVMIGFLSQVLRQNRERIARWDEELVGLSPEDRHVWLTGLWYSRTSEGDAILKEVIEGKISEEEGPPKILEMPLDQPATLDMLWGFFFATGSESPIRRLALAFRFEELAERPPGAQIPEGYAPLYEQLPEMISWSLSSMVKTHPRVGEICEQLYSNPKAEEVSNTERRWLRQRVLPAYKPDKYPAPPESLRKPSEPEAPVPPPSDKEGSGA